MTDSGTDRLARMLHAAHELPPWLVPEYVRREAQALGARDATLFLQDYDQRMLWPLTNAGLQEPMSDGVTIDGSLAGRAFMLTTNVTGTSPDGARLFIPLLDGADRVGVLELLLDGDPAAADDQQRWSWLAAIAAELVVSKGAYTDTYFRSRRRRPMGLAAEMQWHLLPPLTAADPRIVVAGCLEPAYEVGGDAFDYAINQSIAHLAIFDAMGHGVDASVMSGVAVGAYRHARRAGVPLDEMYASINGAFSREFGSDRFVTAQLATLDLATGALTLVNAGHPAPLLVRGRRVIRAIEGPSALPIGLGDEPPAVVEDTLEPGDRLVLYSDGVIDANRDAELYDEQRFADDVEHVLADELPLAETVRRVNRRLLEWRGGTTRDDSTLMFVEWRSRELPGNPID